MSTTPTAFLGLELPVPGSQQPYTVAGENAMFTAIDANAQTVDGRLAGLEGQPSIRGTRALFTVIDLDGLAGLTGPLEGDLAYCDEGNFFLTQGDAGWHQVTTPSFADATAREAAFAKAAAAYLVAGATAKLVDTDRTYEYVGTVWVPMLRASFEPIRVAVTAASTVNITGSFAALNTNPLTHDLVVPRACRAKITFGARINVTASGGGVILALQVSGATTKAPATTDTDVVWFVADGAAGSHPHVAVAFVDLLAGTNTISVVGQAIGSGSTRNIYTPYMVIEPVT